MSNLNTKYGSGKPLSTDNRCTPESVYGRKLSKPFSDKFDNIDWSDYPEKNRPYSINLIRNSKKECIYTPEHKKKVHPKRSKVFGVPEINLGVYNDSCRDETGNE